LWSIEQGRLKKPPREPTADQQSFLDTEPDIDYGLALFCHAYSRLSTERALGYGIVGPIPMSAIDRWCERRRYDDDTAEHFIAVVLHVDAETMRRQSSRK
jgi:hypothetical protein